MSSDRPAKKIECILSACRGMSHGMGIDIMYVELNRVTEKGKPGERKPNRAIVTNAHSEKGDREHNKIEALTQTLADRLYLEGFELKKLDLRRMEPVEMKRTEWCMRVCIND